MRVAVVVTTFNRVGYLAELVACLEAQTFGDFEVVIVDNGSTDATFEELTALQASSPLALTTLRLEHNRGPGGGRNAGVALTSAPLLALTDDDALPTPRWLEALVAAFDDPGVVVAQGRVAPDPGTHKQLGPFDHTIVVEGPTPFFETCNVAYRRDAFERVGGFDEDDALLRTRRGRAFGEDAALGAAVLAGGGDRAFVPEAVVHHRCIPRTFADHLADRRQLRLFPALARRTPLLRSTLLGGVFLNAATARYDIGVVGVVAALILRQPLALVAALPWVAHRVRTTGWYRGGPRLFAKYAVADAVTFASLVEGSARHRRLVL